MQKRQASFPASVMAINHTRCVNDVYQPKEISYGTIYYSCLRSRFAIKLICTNENPMIRNHLPNGIVLMGCEKRLQRLFRRKRFVMASICKGKGARNDCDTPEMIFKDTFAENIALVFGEG